MYFTTAEASSNPHQGLMGSLRAPTSEAVKDLTDFFCRNRSEGFRREVKGGSCLVAFVLSAGFMMPIFRKAQPVRRRLFRTDQRDVLSLDVLH